MKRVEKGIFDQISVNKHYFEVFQMHVFVQYSVDFFLLIP